MKNSAKHYPASLKRFPVWGLWRLELDENGRLTKVPYSPHYDGRAKSNDLSTWGTFDQAINKFESRPDYYNGISLIISQEYELVFIDIDHCVDEDGVLNETASAIVGSFGEQFMEFSQSGTGIHIITRGTIPKSFRNSQNGVEMYSNKRFCALTGNVLFKGEPTEEQSVLDDIFNRYKTPDRAKKPVRSKNKAFKNVALKNYDQWVIDHARKRGRFDGLYSGNWKSWGYDSQSEADLAMCLILAFWTDCDPDQIDRIFRSSGLYREKWDRKHKEDGSTYGEMTVTTAIDQCDDTVSDYMKRKNEEGGERLDRAMREDWDN